MESTWLHSRQHRGTSEKRGVARGFKRHGSGPIATAAGLTLVEIMRDEGVSASKPLDKRPAGMALMRP